MRRELTQTKIPCACQRPQRTGRSQWTLKWRARGLQRRLGRRTLAL